MPIDNADTQLAGGVEEKTILSDDELSFEFDDEDGSEGSADKSLAGDEEQEGADDEDELEPSEDDEDDESESDPDEDERPKERKSTIDDERVILRDGSTVTVADLKRIAGDVAGELQRGRGEIQAEKAEVERAKQHVTQFVQQVREDQRQAALILRAVIPPKPDPSLLEADPLSYNEQMAKHQLGVDRYRQFAGRVAEADRQQAAEIQAREEQRAAQEHQKLLQRRPDLKEPVKAKAYADKITNGLVSEFGYTPDEARQLTDSRLFHVVEMALKGVAVTKAKPNLQKKAQAAPPMVVKPGVRTSGAQKRADRMRADMNELRKTGSKHLADRLLSSFD